MCSAVTPISISPCKSHLASSSCCCCWSQFPSHPHVLLRCWFLVVKKGRGYNPLRATGCHCFYLGCKHTKRQSQECLVPASDIPHQHISVSLIKQSFYWVFAGFHKVQEKLWTSTAPELSVPRFWLDRNLLSPCPILN